MSLLKISGFDLVRSVKAGCIRLEHNRDQVDMLNVFPVPDGDTGTNMYLTLLSAVKEGEKSSQQNIGKAAKAISMGSLMGARGNSGVILSQILRGVAKVMEGKEEANAQDIAHALKAGSDTAYKAVMKPVEGTILTIIREVSRVCEEEAKKENDILATLLAGIEEGHKTLAKTPSMLPVLKEAGVVDAGGQGFLYFLEGLVDGLASEKDIALDVYREKISTTRKEVLKEDIQLEFQYCTELLIKGENLEPEDIKDHLRPLGDSMMVVGGDELVKVHIHSNHPGKVLETGLQFGQLSDIKINNMLEEVHEHLNNWEEETSVQYDKKLGLVAVGVGVGLVEILKSLGVDEIVEGGQTMNPSTEDLLFACQNANAEKVILLPNNSNIIMAAEQVKNLCEKEVCVVPTKSVMQAISALIAYHPEGAISEVAQAMTEEMQNIVYAEVTMAVRDSDMNGLDIKDGDNIGILQGNIEVKGTDVEEVVISLLEKMVGEDSQLITLLYGDNVDEENAINLSDKLEEIYPDYEIEVHSGGQPHYNYFIAVE
ncbi:MAG: DAK2 domain-containing protein [Bacillota bacterium]|nr:DAK2 domain-containing protein [Bacillota bacterium]